MMKAPETNRNQRHNDLTLATLDAKDRADAKASSPNFERNKINNR